MKTKTITISIIESGSTYTVYVVVEKTGHMPVIKLKEGLRLHEIVLMLEQFDLEEVSDSFIKDSLDKLFQTGRVYIEYTKNYKF